MADYSYIGSGKIYARDRNGAGGLIEIGNASALTISPQEETQTQRDYTQPGGGAFNEVRRISAVNFSMTAAELSPQNLARALYGSNAAQTLTALTNQLMGIGYRDAYLAFPALQAATPAPVIRARNGRTAVARANTTAYALNAYLIPATPNGLYYRVTTAGTSSGTIPVFPTTPGVTVTDGTVVLTCMGRIVLTAGTDYELRPSGLVILPAAAFTDGEAVEADFTRAASDLVQMLTSAASEFEIIFDGLNEARSGKRALVRLHRVRLGPAQELGLIADGYGAIQQSGSLLADTTIVGAGISQYATIQLEA